MEIKKLSDKDINKTSEMLKNYWKERGMNYSSKWAKEYIMEGHRKEILQDIFFLAKENEEIIGSISIIVHEGDLVELRDFVVLLAHRGKGIGKALFDHALSWCLQNNIRKIYCLSFPYLNNFWLKQGFILEGELKNHFKDEENLLIFSKFLKKEDKQIDLKQKIEEIESIKNIESGTSEMLK